MLADSKFPPLLRKHNNIYRGTSQQNNNTLSPDEFLVKLKHHFNHNLSDVPNFSRVSILLMNNYDL